MSHTNYLFTANTGSVEISTANSNLDGTGTLGLVLTAANNGTTVFTITIKGTGSTTQGMVRLFVSKNILGTTYYFLYKEVMIPENTPTGVIPSISYVVNEPFNLEPGCALYASTQKAESFIVTAMGENWTNCECIA